MRPESLEHRERALAFERRITQAADIEIHAKDLLKMRERLNGILAEHTGQAIEKIAKDTDRDYILEAEDAKKYGLVDAIYHRRDESSLKAAG